MKNVVQTSSPEEGLHNQQSTNASKGAAGATQPTAAKRNNNFQAHTIARSPHGPPPPHAAEPPHLPGLPGSASPGSATTSAQQMPHISTPPSIASAVLASLCLDHLPASRRFAPSFIATALRNVAMAFSRQASVVLLVLAAILGVASYAEGQVLFSKLPKSLIVTATLPGGGPITEVQTGQDTIVVSWTVNATAAPIANATKVRTKLCFAKESQVLRGWRATKDNLKKDKTCLYDVATVEFTAAGASANYKLKKSVPGAKYFARAYAINASGVQVAYGQSSPDKVANTFTVIPITGRHTSIDVAVGVFSVFSVGSLFAFFIMENIYLKRKKAV